MAKYNCYEELPVWQQAARLYHQIDDLLNAPQSPVTAVVRNQLERAALEVANQVASGYEQSVTARLTDCLEQARAAAIDIRSTMSLIGQKQRLASQGETLQQIRQSADSCIRQISAWMHAIQGTGNRAQRSNQQDASAEADSGGLSAHRSVAAPAAAAPPAGQSGPRARAVQRPAPPSY